MSIIKSLSVGEGDMFYIVHNSDNFTVIDCCMDENNRDGIVEEINEKRKEKNISRFISTHPDEDHLQGLEYLNQHSEILNFYCVRNEATKDEPTSDFNFYCNMRDGDKHYFVEKGCSRKWLNQSDSERGSSGINFFWPDTKNEYLKEALDKAKTGEAFNNISPVFTYSVQDGVTVMWMGDMEHDFLENIKGEIDWPEIDILFAPHHGRNSGKVSEDVLKKLNPHIVVIGEAPSKYLNYYNGYNTITQNSAGDISFKCIGDTVQVYVSNPEYSYDTSFLTKQEDVDVNLGKYLGSFKVKKA